MEIQIAECLNQEDLQNELILIKYIQNYQQLFFLMHSSTCLLIDNLFKFLKILLQIGHCIPSFKVSDLIICLSLK